MTLIGKQGYFEQFKPHYIGNRLKCDPIKPADAVIQDFFPLWQTLYTALL